MKNLKNKIIHWTKLILEFCLNPRLLLCFGLAWLITNGWSYIALGLSIWLDLKWLGIIASAYLTTLWLPFTPEKIITVIISIFLLKILFPNDKKTLEKLFKVKTAIAEQIKESRKKRREKKAEKRKNKR